MNPDINKLHPYPFEKLRDLKQAVDKNTSFSDDKAHIALSIGEPKHQAPDIAAKALTENLVSIANYPVTIGTEKLRETIIQWLIQRFNLESSDLNAQHCVIPVNGTREALFSFAQAVIDRTKNDALVMMPNPFYQIYEGATLLAGAEPYYLNTIADGGFIPDFEAVPQSIWKRCQLIYICSPGNPSGAVMDETSLSTLIQLADRYDFIIASDECYSELYFDEHKAPIGLLEVAAKMGRHDFKRCVVFHSLSKRSNVPGMRSGFVAGDADIMQKYLQYRTYHGCAVPLFIQAASVPLWQDEQHVKHNRDLYREKFRQVIQILSPVLDNVTQPDASFYLWLATPIADIDFAQQLYAQQNVTVLPGSYLSRDTDQGNPGENYVRIALVATLEECLDAAQRIRDFVESLKN